MYLGVDIGGTKTLVAALSPNGEIVEQAEFHTAEDYDQFMRELASCVESLTTKGFAGAACGVPGLINRETGTVHSLGNLPWRDKPIRDDISKLLENIPVIIENDSKLAGLSEAQLIPEYQNVLFLTISTGINGALVHDRNLVQDLRDAEMGKMPLLHEGRYIHWEDFAGGRSVVNRFHKKASEITDPDEWRRIAETLNQGLAPLVSVLQPEVVVLGGSVGALADHYSAYLVDFLRTHLHPNVRQPKVILQAQRPREAVLYGCFELAKQVYG